MLWVCGRGAWETNKKGPVNEEGCAVVGWNIPNDRGETQVFGIELQLSAPTRGELATGVSDVRPFLPLLLPLPIPSIPIRDYQLHINYISIANPLYTLRINHYSSRINNHYHHEMIHSSFAPSHQTTRLPFCS